jgi:hypothetical protein
MGQGAELSECVVHLRDAIKVAQPKPLWALLIR